MKQTIAINGENIILGETELPIQQIRSVEVSLDVPRRLVLFAFVGLAIFIIVAVSIVGLALSAILSANADSTSTSSILRGLFSIAVIFVFLIGIFATLAYPIKWRVQVVTLQGAYVVLTDRSRTRATIYADRIRRVIQQTRS